jgi:hypothetical protein
VTEDKRKKVPASLYLETSEEIQTEQSRLRRELSKKPSLADVIEMAWVAYKEAQAEKAKRGEPAELDPQHAEYVAAFLEAIKVSQNWTQMKPILEPYLKPKAPAAKPKRISDKIRAS